MTRMIRLHHCAQSRSMRSLWLLEELGVEFETILHPFDKSLRDATFLAMSPAGRVPALEIDGSTMFETGAICEYLCERFPAAGLGRAPGDVERRDWLVWLHFAETISQHVATLTQQHVVLYEDTMRAPIIMKLEVARLGKCCEALEQRFEISGESLLESGFSAVDIAVGQAIYMARYFIDTAAWPGLERWYANITARPAFAASLPKPGQERLYARDFYPVWEQAK